ncbi:MAG: tyrosine recombinase XerC [Eubacteriales bacterium]|nr:tyrosine recombinase XerC [Eubacteriales bacterium]
MPALLQDFLNYIFTIKGKSANTVQVYFYDLRLFLRFMLLRRGLVKKELPFDEISIKEIGADFIDSITLSDLYAYMSYVTSERGNTSCPRARKVASLKSFFNYLSNKAGIIHSNPAAELESPKILKKLPRYLNVEESKSLLSSVGETSSKYPERDYAILTIFLNCGLRLSELVGMNIRSIRDNVLTVTGKGGKERTVYLNGACTEALDAYLKVRGKTPGLSGPNLPAILKDRQALFLSERRQRISKNMVQYIVKKYIRQAGLDPSRYSTHKLRHTAATLMYRYGKVDIRTLQELLGHESISTTEIYTHLDEKQIKEAVESNPLAGYRQKNSYDKD